MSPNSGANPAHQPPFPGGPEDPYKSLVGSRPEDPGQDQDGDHHRDHHHHLKDQDESPASSTDGGADDPGHMGSRLKVYIKPNVQASEEVKARRSRKNSQSRGRASKHRSRVADIETKSESERSPEEQQIFEMHQNRRQRKNDRSRERALEKKEEIDRILAKPEKKRSRIEMQFLETALGAKKRKNEGDRLRRHRLKELGLSPKGSVGKPGIPARGPLPAKYAHHLPDKQPQQQHQQQLQHPPMDHGHGGGPHHGGYGMPPPGYPVMMPPPHHPHDQDPHSPGAGASMYQL